MANKTVAAVVKLIDDFSAPSREVMTASRNVEKRFKDMSKTIEDAGAVMTNTGRSMRDAIALPLAAVGTASVAFAAESQNAMNQFAAATGMATGAMGEYQNAINEVYKGNFGESINDVAQGMGLVKQNIDGIDASNIAEVTEYGYAMQDVFGMDLAENTRAANTLMQNFGVSAQEAYNLMAQGAQNGLDYSGEMLDSISEYSVQFAKVGLDAEDMFNIFASGAENGAFNLDKIGDAVKEFSIRAIDGSKTTQAGFEALGMDADEMAAKFAAGGEGAEQAFNQVIQGLANMDDPVAQSIAGVNLFGTMWEDLGPEVVTSLSTANGAIDSTKNSLDDLMSVKYDSLSSALGELWRTIQVDVLQPIGDMLIPYVEIAIDKVGEFVDWWNSLGDATQQTIVKFGLIAAAIGPVLMVMGSVTTAIGGVTRTIGSLGGAIMKFAPQSLVNSLKATETGALKAGSSFRLFTGGLGSIGGTVLKAVPILAAVAAVGLAIYKNWDTISPALGQLGAAFMQLWTTIQPIVNAIQMALQTIAAVVLPVFQAAFEGVLSAIGGFLTNFISTVTEIVASLTQIFQGIIDFMTGVFTGNWQMIFDGLANIVSGAFSGIVSTVKGILNGLISIVNGLIDGINSIKFQVPAGVPIIGGKGFGGFNIPHIPSFYTGVEDWVGGPAEINEPRYGGEIVDLPEGSRVYPHDESIKLAREDGQRSGMSINIPKLADTIVIREDADIERIAEAFIKKVEQVAYNMA